MKEEDWISVEDRLPDSTDEDVLVYDDREGVQIADYDSLVGWINYERGYLDHVTHWMPLVLPIKSNGEEE